MSTAHTIANGDIPINGVKTNGVSPLNGVTITSESIEARIKDIYRRARIVVSALPNQAFEVEEVIMLCQQYLEDIVGEKALHSIQEWKTATRFQTALQGLHNQVGNALKT